MLLFDCLFETLCYVCCDIIICLIIMLNNFFKFRFTLLVYSECVAMSIMMLFCCFVYLFINNIYKAHHSQLNVF